MSTVKATVKEGNKGRVVYVIENKPKHEVIRSVNYLSTEECIQAMINRLKGLNN